MEQLTVAGVTKVVIGDGLPVPIIPSRDGRTRVVILTQPAVTSRASEIARALEDDGLNVEIVGLPDRDEAKTLEVAGSVYEAFVRFGMSRQDTVLGVGGGSVTDLAGYVAGTWLRGVEVIHFPTTLLGAVDASIGGKTGVNLAGKNLVGVIWHPTRVVIDVRLLESLPPPLKMDGMAEAYKAGLIGDEDLATLFSETGVNTPLDEVVPRAVTVKARIVSEDDREHGVRAVLNFGHTIGHAIEFSSAYSHGESVALGMVAAAQISEKKLGFDRACTIRTTLESIGLPTETTGLDVSRIKDLLALDKKRDGEGLRMVLLEDIGVPIVQHVDHEDVELGLAAVGL